MTGHIPYSSIQEFEENFLKEWAERVTKITQDTQFVGGKWVESLESRLAKEANTKFSVACANGTDAIQIALRVFNIGNKDTVLIPDFTFWATFEAVCNVGAIPVTLDIDPNSLHITAALVKKGILAFKPKAVILVHLFGWAAPETKEIRELCKEEGVSLIEDSAQAWGVTLDKKPLLSEATISTVSFYPGKVLGAAGDGGAILTNDEKLAAAARLLANHGRRGKYEHIAVGWNSRLDNLQAAYLDLALNYLPERLSSRRKAITYYKENISEKKIQLLSPSENIMENGYISVASLAPKDREMLIEVLAKSDIGYGIVYPETISRQSGAKKWLGGKLDKGNAHAITQRVLNLPCFAGISVAQLKRVCEVVNRGLK